jgi:hypothetical protein
MPKQRCTPRGYKFAIQWIALNDANGDDQAPEQLAGYVSVVLVADIYGKDQDEVAKDVYNLRHPSALKRAFDVLLPKGPQ